MYPSFKPQAVHKLPLTKAQMIKDLAEALESNSADWFALLNSVRMLKFDLEEHHRRD